MAARALHIWPHMSAGTVFIVDDDAANRDLYSAILASVGIANKSFASGQEFFTAFDPTEMGCILLDVRMPGMSGIDVQRQLVKEEVPHPVIVVTGHGDVSVAIDAMKAGAFDFMEKPIRNQLLLDLVQRALKTGSEAADQWQQLEELRGRFETLTSREREVLTHVLNGEPNKGVARNLNISVKTVELHRGNVMQKTKAHSLAELIRMAVKLGLDKEVRS